MPELLTITIVVELPDGTSAATPTVRVETQTPGTEPENADDVLLPGVVARVRASAPRPLSTVILDYLRRVDATLVPFGGRFLTHGEAAEWLEGAGRGDCVIVEFPDRASARAWYASPAYQAILPLRTRNAASNVLLVDTVAQDYRAADLAAKLAPS